MKVLVIGSKGSMGKRYCAILKYLNVEFEPIDILEQPWDYSDIRDCDRAIVCTPTETHFDICRALSIDYLCEKPVSKKPEMIKRLIQLAGDKNIDARMVCNWYYIGYMYTNLNNEIEYSNYNTGKDGINWDCIQLHYLSNTKAIVSNDTPFFKCKVNGNNNPVYLGDIEHSYITMIKAWLRDPKDLWSLEDALKATEKVIKIDTERHTH